MFIYLSGRHAMLAFAAIDYAAMARLMLDTRRYAAASLFATLIFLRQLIFFLRHLLILMPDDAIIYAAAAPRRQMLAICLLFHFRR